MVAGSPGARRDRKPPFPWVSPERKPCGPSILDSGLQNGGHNTSLPAGRWAWGQSHSDSQARIPALHGAALPANVCPGTRRPHGPACPRAPNRAPCPAECGPWGGSGRWGQPLLLEEDIRCPQKVFARWGEWGA